jgi:hypothetical protein
MPEPLGNRTGLRRNRHLLCVWLASGLILPADYLPAQSPTLPLTLNIVVVEGEGVTHTVAQRGNRDPIVRVEDENHNPVVSAVVVFALPTEGATGEFGNGSKILTVVTDKLGAAKAQGLKLNQVGGKLPIHVTASYRGLTARAIIQQFVEGVPGAKAGGSGGHGKLVAILAVIGAAAAGGTYAATRKSGSGSTTPSPTPTGPTPIGISPGTGSIAPPH